jgi:hypothetical protein
LLLLLLRWRLSGACRIDRSVDEERLGIQALDRRRAGIGRWRGCGRLRFGFGGDGGISLRRGAREGVLLESLKSMQHASF